MRWTRREAMGAAAKAAVLAVAGGVVHMLQRAGLATYPVGRRPAAVLAGILRPPGALPEGDFLAACIRCYRCQDACAPGAIQFYTERHGALYHTPYVDPAMAGCTLCMACGPACPTGALIPHLERSAADMGSVALNTDLCLSYRAQDLRDRQALLAELGREDTASSADSTRRGPCGECFMFCPLRNRAITLKPGGFLAPVIHVDHCVGCGMCEEICRTMVRGEPAIRVVRTRRPAHAGGSPS